MVRHRLHHAIGKPKYPGLVPKAYHIYVDGSCYRAEDQSAWAFVVVTEDIMGDFVLEGFAADFLSQHDAADMACSDVDNICVEAVSILCACSWLLGQIPIPATINFDCTPCWFCR